MQFRLEDGVFFLSAAIIYTGGETTTIKEDTLYRYISLETEQYSLIRSYTVKHWIQSEEKGTRESLEKSLLLVSQAEIKILEAKKNLEVPQGLDVLDE